MTANHRFAKSSERRAETERLQDRSQYRLALAGLVMTLIGLVTLFVTPLAVGIRLQRDFGKIDALERSRLAISTAIESARKSDEFLMHRYAVPGATSGRYDADEEYRGLLADWRRAIADLGISAPLNGEGRTAWASGTTLISDWIERDLVKYTRHGSWPGASEFERKEENFQRGFGALASARQRAIDQQRVLREREQWLSTAQVTVVTPMAIICFALAFLAWMNVRTLQQAWIRERAVSADLQVAVQESNHRIKNNLQVIGALIDMQIQGPGHSVPKASLENVVHQVRAVAAVHDFFSRELKSDQIQGDEMLRRLIELSASPIGLRVDLETEALELGVKEATAVALITNELLLNSGKHGATEAHVIMKSDGAVAQLRVSDNGPGFPEEFGGVQDANLGLALVDSLARHDLRGEINFVNDGGARVEIIFPIGTGAAPAN